MPPFLIIMLVAGIAPFIFHVHVHVHSLESETGILRSHSFLPYSLSLIPYNFALGSGRSRLDSFIWTVCIRSIERTLSVPVPMASQPFHIPFLFFPSRSRSDVPRCLSGWCRFRQIVKNRMFHLITGRGVRQLARPIFNRHNRS